MRITSKWAGWTNHDYPINRRSTINYSTFHIAHHGRFRNSPACRTARHAGRDCRFLRRGRISARGGSASGTTPLADITPCLVSRISSPDSNPPPLHYSVSRISSPDSNPPPLHYSESHISHLPPTTHHLTSTASGAHFLDASIL